MPRLSFDANRGEGEIGMKNIFCLICFFVLNSNLYGININIDDLYTSIFIDDNTMKVEYYDSDIPVSEEYSVQWEIINKIYYINFDYNGNFLGEKIARDKKRYLVLYNGYLIFYNNQNQAEYYLCGFRPQSDQSSYVDTKITASSELKENDINYRADNLFNKGNLAPWVEGVSGDGIGQAIRIEFKTPLVFGLNGIYISNGFIDYNRPYLYEYNNRIKKIRVSYIGYNEYKEFEIEDIPNFQYIHLDMNYKPNIVLIEIVEVYKGSRWEDTCINNILPVGF
jgi:hypothetical protein